MKKITVARGDGIGPEIMDATLKILSAAKAEIEPEFIEIGKSQYLAGNSTGMNQDAWDSIRSNRIILKAPVTTPQGGGYKSLNVTIRKTLGLFANVRPCRSFTPYVETYHPHLDVVIVRENEEDLYAGIEHRQTVDVAQALKLISRPGSERVIRYAFEYARAYGRKKVTVMIKDNIMKISDGMFHRIFNEIKEEYPEIESEQQIIDIGTARLASAPERYDVVVTPNLYGDIISDVVAEISGSVGMAGSANIGKNAAMFEAIHGSAPDIAGRKLANPSGLINASVMMLVHIGMPETAQRIENAWLKTIEDGIHTAEIYSDGHSTHLANTDEFADAVIERLGATPGFFHGARFSPDMPEITIPDYQRPDVRKVLAGVDVFIDHGSISPDELGNTLNDIAGASRSSLRLKVITNRGVKVYPQGFPETFTTDHWRCRFLMEEPPVSAKAEGLEPESVIEIQQLIMGSGLEIIKTENLYYFDGEAGYSMAQGE